MVRMRFCSSAAVLRTSPCPLRPTIFRPFLTAKSSRLSTPSYPPPSHRPHPLARRHRRSARRPPPRCARTRPADAPPNRARPHRRRWLRCCAFGRAHSPHALLIASGPKSPSSPSLGRNIRFHPVRGRAELGPSHRPGRSPRFRPHAPRSAQLRSSATILAAVAGSATISDSANGAFTGEIIIDDHTLAASSPRPSAHA